MRHNLKNILIIIIVILIILLIFFKINLKKTNNTKELDKNKIKANIIYEYDEENEEYVIYDENKNERGRVKSKADFKMYEDNENFKIEF